MSGLSPPTDNFKKSNFFYNYRINKTQDIDILFSFSLNLNNEDSYRTNLFYSIMDAVLIELNDRFSFHNMEILNGISALCLDS